MSRTEIDFGKPENIILLRKQADFLSWCQSRRDIVEFSKQNEGILRSIFLNIRLNTRSGIINVRKLQYQIDKAVKENILRKKYVVISHVVEA